MLRGMICGAALLLSAFSPDRPGPDPGPARAPEEAERDEILILLAYSLAAQDWQPQGKEEPRGHNIVAVLASPTFEIVGWAPNSTAIEKDSTQHAEVRAVQQQLRKARSPYLRGHTLYSTLEPCAMCAGMMMFSNVQRVVYGQRDPQYGRAVERLCLDARALPNGYAPYPAALTAVPADTPSFYCLEAAYGTSTHRKRHDLVGWLQTPEAREIFQEALKTLLGYRVQHERNGGILKSALKLLEEQGGARK